jgi:hypothetical protein
MSTKLSSLLVVLGSALPAQSTQLRGPVAGAVFDPPTRSIRWIVGAPGAAYLGAAVAHGVDFAAVSPDGALAVAVQGGSLHLLHLGSNVAAATLEIEAGAVDGIVWSRDSTAVAVHGSGTRVWKNLATAPERIDLAGVERARWTALAVEPGADAVLAAAEDGLYLLTAARARLVAPVPSPSAIALSADGDVVYVTSRARREVVAIRHWRGSAEIALVAGGIEDPVAVSLGGDGRSLLVAGGVSRSLVEVDLSGHTIRRQWELDFQPARIERLASGAFRLNDRAAAEPLQVLTSGTHSSVLFVPALQ